MSLPARSRRRGRELIICAAAAVRLNELPAETEAVAYCRSAYYVLAHEAFRLLNDRGYQARHTGWGALEWRIGGLLASNGAA